jgi:Cu/Ag efflux protein CusF
MKTILFVVMLMAVFSFAACRAAPAKRYPIQGEVISVDAPKKLLTVKHGEITGLMPAMTMSYAVAREKEIEALKPGDKISAELVVSDNVGRLENIVSQPKTENSGSNSNAMPSKAN